MTSEWYAVWWYGGKRAMAKMGAYPTTGLSEARKAVAADYASAIAKGERPESPHARKSRLGVTIKDLFQSYVVTSTICVRPGRHRQSGSKGFS